MSPSASSRRFRSVLPLLVPPHQRFGVLGGNIRPLETRGLRLPRRNEEHVPVAEQRLGAHAVDDRAAVHLRCHAKRDATRKVRLDQSRDDVDARSLRREQEVNADRARLLREARERRLDLALHRHHQIRELVDHDDDVRQDLAAIVACPRTQRPCASGA